LEFILLGRNTLGARHSLPSALKTALSLFDE